MKFKITYYVNQHALLCCGAGTEYQGNPISGCGRTWDEAKKNLTENLERLVNTTPPPPDMVEITEGGVK